MNDDSTDGSSRSGWFARIRGLLKGEPATRQDLLELLRDRRWRRILDKDELAMLQGVLEVSDTQVREVMVPRAQMVVVEHDESREELLERIIESGHSRFPVIGEDRDEVIGILLAKDLLRWFMRSGDAPFRLEQHLRPAAFIPESKRLDTLLEEFRNSRNHMAIVVDEYGGTAGLLTIEDVLEQIVGDIDDEHDPEESQQIHDEGDGCWQVSALTRIEDFNEYFGTTLSDKEYDTVGGLVIHEFGRLPGQGESMASGGFRFQVRQADVRRVHSLEVVREATAVADEAASQAS